MWLFEEVNSKILAFPRLPRFSHSILELLHEKEPTVLETTDTSNKNSYMSKTKFAKLRFVPREYLTQLETHLGCSEQRE